jgi:1-acyl-sn-glycerol-3-phosphate acyltransferase
VGERHSFSRAAKTLLGWVIIIASLAVWAVFVIPPTLLLQSAWPGVRDRFSDLTSALLRVYVRSLLFMRLRVEGREYRIKEPRLLAINHQSWLDPIVMLGLEPRAAGPAKSSMLRAPVMGTVLRIVGFYDFALGGVPGLERMQRSAQYARERDGGLLFFPEGTRSRTGEIGPFRRGAFRMAVDHDLPIQPVVIEGLDRVLPPGNSIVKSPGRPLVRVRYLPAIHPPYGSGVRRDVVRALTDRVRNLLVDELARMRAERTASCGEAAADPRA